MPDRAIVNASPLIFLGNAGYLHFLRFAAGEVLVPGTVANEIRKGRELEPAVKAIESSEWLRVVETPIVPPLVQAWDLGPGESAVLAYAYAHTGTVAVLDDLAGRRCAEALGIPVTGTLGLVLGARKRGMIPAARPVLEELRDNGMYLSSAVLERALALVGE